MNSNQFRRWLMQQDANFKLGKGGHLRVDLNGKRCVLPMHGSYSLGSNMIQTIIKQLGLEAKQDTLG